MESLQLPQDLYWDVKMEPDSPSSEFIALINNEDSWLFEDNFAKDVLSPPEKNEIDISSNCSPLSNESELLYEFEFDVKPEQWMDDKSNVHQLMDYTEVLIPPQNGPTQVIKVQNPLEIFMELEKIYDVTELTQLTPPQTPPQESNEVKEIFDLITQQNSCPLTATVNDSNNINNNNNNENVVIDNIISAMSPSNSDYSSDVENCHPMPSDIAREMQIVDEILRTRAKELPDWTDDDESLHSSSSALSSTSSALSSSSALHSNDDEWIPSEITNATAGLTSGKITHEKSQKRRTRPYGRPVEDKKVRKKEQNKNAATRYRQKKKQEMEVVLEEERLLVIRNEELTKQFNDVEREVKYLKQLIKEFHKSKKSTTIATK